MKNPCQTLVPNAQLPPELHKVGSGPENVRIWLKFTVSFS